MTQIANLDTIVAAKNEFLEKVKSALDLKQIKKILEEQHNLEITDDLEVNTADVVIHNNQLAFKMDFEVLLSLSVLLDGNGNFISPEETADNIDKLGSQAEDIVQGM